MNFTKNFRDCHCSADRLEVIVTVSTESLEEVASPSIWDAVATQVKWAEPREFCCWFPRPPPRLPVRPPCHCHALYCFWLISIFPTTTQGILPLENNFYFMYFPIADAVNKRIFVNTAAAISVGDERCAAVNICSLLLIHVLQFFFLHHFGVCLINVGKEIFPIIKERMFLNVVVSRPKKKFEQLFFFIPFSQFHSNFLTLAYINLFIFVSSSHNFFNLA